MNSTRGEKKDRGFSLVEMIVVIAIMAILVGVLAPVYLRYVEKSRKQRDDTAAEEIRRAAEIVVFSGEYQVLAGTVVTFDSTNGIKVVSGGAEEPVLKAQLEELFGDLSKTKPESNTYANKTYQVSIMPAATPDGIPEMVGEWQ